VIRSKQAIREDVWQALKQARAARFPGARGRIPDFVGAESFYDRKNRQDRRFRPF
jgi:5-formyltetrahydrofolate cyclo-ligase